LVDVLNLPLDVESTLQRSGLILEASRREMLCRYVELLLEWNKRINLISRRDTENIWSSHILHSLSPLFMLKIQMGVTVLDLGSGGGLPGIPLAIVHGGLNVTLLDSIQKKTNALQSIVDALNLSSVRVVTGRAEDVGGLREHSGAYDMVIARAVAPLQDLVSWSRPFIRRRGLNPTGRVRLVVGQKNEFSFPYLLALKGGEVEQERRGVLGKLSADAITEIGLVFPGSEGLRLNDKKLLVVELT
jgi:16S rRNA (guanine527-N7)-methyltransferase